MRGSILLAMGLLLSPVVGSVPAAEALGGGVCTVSGTITFSAASLTAKEGAWAIGPAVISCQGMFRLNERMQGAGSLAAAGSYTAFPDGSGTCLHHMGTGTVDYSFPTTSADIHLVEQGTYTLAGAGFLSTPSLRGAFQVAPLKGDCVTAPVTSGVFVAEALLVRFVPPGLDRYLP